LNPINDFCRIIFNQKDCCMRLNILNTFCVVR
jgi:hypothetical protein